MSDVRRVRVGRPVSVATLMPGDRILVERPEMWGLRVETIVAIRETVGPSVRGIMLGDGTDVELDPRHQVISFGVEE